MTATAPSEERRWPQAPTCPTGTRAGCNLPFEDSDVTTMKPACSSAVLVSDEEAQGVEIPEGRSDLLPPVDAQRRRNGLEILLR